MGIRKVGIANLPPEVPDRTIRDNLAKYGEVKNIKEELWTKAYRYKRDTDSENEPQPAPTIPHDNSRS